MCTATRKQVQQIVKIKMGGVTTNKIRVTNKCNVIKTNTIEHV